MKNMIRFEIDKLVNSISFLAGLIVTALIMFCIFFVGFHYSQLSLVEKSNEAKGVDNLYWQMEEKYTGVFDDQVVMEILKEYMHQYQQNSVENRPFNLFSSNIANVFFPKDRDVYIEMNDAIREGDEISIDTLDILSIDDVGFAEFKDPLILGNYVPWYDLFKVSGYIFILLSVICIIISSLIFSNDCSKNINQLLFTTQYGRTKLTKAKILSSVIICLGIYAIVNIVLMVVFLVYNHGMSGWDASIQTNFSMGLYSIPLELNNLQVWVITTVFYIANLIAIIGITLLISSLFKSPVGALLIALGLFILPLGLTYVFKNGVISEVLYLFPINNFDTEKLLSILSGKSIIFSNSIIGNYVLMLILLLFVFIVTCIITYTKINKMKDIN